MSRWDDTLRAKLDEILGERGRKDRSAVRWGDIEAVYQKAALVAEKVAGSGGSGGSGGTGEIPEDIQEQIDASRALAQQAASQAQAAAVQAGLVHDEHAALVSGFLGNLSDAFALRDQALSNLSTSTTSSIATLTANINGVSANLSTNYLTAAQTNQAISSASTALSSSIAQTQAFAETKGKVIYSATAPDAADRLAQNLWIDTTSGANTPKMWNGVAWVAVTDKVAADAAAAVATVSANLSTNYLTSAQTNSAIAASQTTMLASIDYVDASVQGFQRAILAAADAPAGAAVTVATAAAALGQTGTIIVTEGSAARSTSGQTNGARVEIPTARALMFGGQRIKIGVLAKRPASNAATRFGIAYSTNGDGDSGYMQADKDLTTAWQWFTFHYTVPAPAVGGADWIGIFGDHSKTGKATQIARVYVEIAAVAGELPEINQLSGEITNILGLQISPSSALATQLTSLQTQANQASASITAQGTALSTLQNNASASYLFRAKAGTANAELELVAASSPTGSVSTARISADNILLDGTVAAQKLVVTDFSGNLILNGAIPYGDTRGWGPMPTTFAIVPRDPNSPYDPVKTAPSPYILHMSPNTSHRFVVVGEFTCEAGEMFATQYNAASAVAQGCNIGIQFVWIGADGQQKSASRSTVINYSGWQKIVTPEVTAPEGTVKCILRAIRWGDSSASIGLLSNMEVVKKRSGAVLITPGSISADDIQAGRMNARHLEVTELLEMDAENAGFVLGKRAVLDTTDGVYMGAVGEHGFGFAASRTAGAIRQSVTLDPINGFVLRNARHRVTGATLPQSATVTASKTIDLPTGTKSLSLMLLGGGGGGASGSWVDEGIIRGNGAKGGATIVQLYDGPTLVGTYEAPGGVGATEGTSGDNGGGGESSSYGRGGSKGTSSYAPTAGSGQGAGGGGGYGLYGRGGKGGKAGSQINRDLDVSLLTAPRLVITIGAPGAGGIPTGTTNTKVSGAAGSAGRVAYTHSAFTDIPADVIPLKPTSVGSFAKAAGATGSTIFPDLGPGLWILDAANSTLVIGTIEIDDQGTLIHANSALNVTFFASKRPLVVSGVGTARTIRYAFYSMGNWG